MQNCILCGEDGGEVIVRNNLFRIVYVEDKNYHGFIRLIINQHIVELSDLDENTAIKILSAVYKLEQIIREIYKPDKMNLASLGNVVPHLHWHIIPRYKNDTHFPNPIWGNITNANYTSSSDLATFKAQLFQKIIRLFK